MVEIIGVRFKSGGKQYYFDPAGLEVQPGQGVIVETSRGLEYGECAQGNTQVEEETVVQPLRPLVRIATEEDEKTVEKNREKEAKAFQICQEKIAAHGLEMKLVEAEYSFEGNKVLFFFTAEGRVDFRALVKDLASTIHARIELRQIGVRDEAKMLGGLGICGRPFCCAQFMDEFLPVSIKMAKTQNLSLNPTKISGTCGRLMCCLKYEQDAYEDAIKRLPKNDSFVLTPDGTGNVSDVNVLKETVNVRLDDRTDGPRCYHNCEVCVLRNGKGSRDGIAVPDKRPERYVEPLAEEELPTITLLSDFDPDAAAESEKKRSRRSRSRRRGDGVPIPPPRAESPAARAAIAAAEADAAAETAVPTPLAAPAHPHPRQSSPPGTAKAPRAARRSAAAIGPAAEAAAVSPTVARRRKSCVNSTVCCWSAISTTPWSTPRRPCKSAWICPPSLTRTAPPSSISWPTAASFPWPPAAPSPPLKRLWTAFP